METKKTFRIQDLNTREDVLGGAVSEDSCYIATYGKIVEGYPKVADLPVDGVTRKVYSLSGQRPTTYAIVRVS